MTEKSSHSHENRLYAKLADQIQEYIRESVYRANEKLPSVRTLAKTHNVSISTAVAAYNHLEDKGVIFARPKSGYFVKQAEQRNVRAPRIGQESTLPAEVSSMQRVMEIMRDSSDPSFVNFGAAVPSPDLPVIRQLKKIFAQKVRSEPFLGIGYDSPKGNNPLRRQLARRAVDAGVHVSPEEIVITPGCQGGIGLCLRILTKPGDIIAVESPCYYGLLQLIEALGLKAVEIPSDAETGISIEALQMALEQWPIKAVLTIPCFNNPVGALMPERNKKRLADLVEQHGIPLIEDDIYGDLCYSDTRPKAVKSYDTEGNVLLCSSVSKTLEPQLGVGWVLPGRYQDQIEYELFLTSVTSFRLPQLAVAELLAHGGYDRHLRYAREVYRQRRDHLTELVAEHFPKGTKMSQPKGGFVAWIQLPGAISSTKLYIQAREQGVLIAPGEIFSSNPKKFPHSIRISYACAWTPQREEAIKLVGELARSSNGA
ncbi:MAG: GntR family transcriptional regulator [Proteobacteria bacterium]|nr:MAG: GntR family transcriptional regulator [Pseudomonadota bacterium]